jgi:hypothetical protein
MSNTLDEFKESWRLHQALKDKEKFHKLTLNEKLEALRLHTIQSVHEDSNE